MTALLKEWQLRLPLFKDLEIPSLYFGGGTPSLHPEVIEEILERASSLNLSSDVEITVEANPENVTSDLVKRLKKSGVNRFSLGVQSLDDSLLKVLGRMHSKDKAVQAIQTIYDAGIENITIDLMNELPHQTLESWNRTLNEVKHLPITHLSLYNLTFEKNTVFTKNESKLRPHLPSEETCVAMHTIAAEKLEKIGLKQYEISAFAKKGYEAVHNTGYWTGRPFLGLGPSAFSYFEGKRFQNCCHLKRYSDKLQEGKDPVDFEETLPLDKSLHERLAIHLRLFRGINLNDFPLKTSGVNILKSLAEDGFLKFDKETVCLTSQGRLFYDTVAERIIL